MQAMDQDSWTDRKGASTYLLRRWGIRRAPSTLGKLASIGGGPTFRHANRQPVYALADLDDWARGLIGLDGGPTDAAA